MICCKRLRVRSSAPSSSLPMQTLLTNMAISLLSLLFRSPWHAPFSDACARWVWSHVNQCIFTRSHSLIVSLFLFYFLQAYEYLREMVPEATRTKVSTITWPATLIQIHTHSLPSFFFCVLFFSFSSCSDFVLLVGAHSDTYTHLYSRTHARPATPFIWKLMHALTVHKGVKGVGAISWEKQRGKVVVPPVKWYFALQWEQIIGAIDPWKAYQSHLRNDVTSNEVLFLILLPFRVKLCLFKVLF